MQIAINQGVESWISEINAETPKKKLKKEVKNQLVDNFHIGKFNIGKFNIGKFNIGKFNIGKFNIGKFNIGKFNFINVKENYAIYFLIL